MILYDSIYFQLAYEPGNDIISLSLPDLVTEDLSEAEHCLEIMLDTVNAYQIQNLLLDSSQARVNVGWDKYQQLIYNVSVKLQRTNLKKVARIVSNNPELETNAYGVQSKVLSTEQSCYQIRNFKEKQEALGWLQERITTAAKL